jgi:hypothetical protein
MDNLPIPRPSDFDPSLIDWSAAIAAATLRLRIRAMPLLQGYMLDAYLAEHPTLTPAVTMTGNALIELHYLIDPDKGTLGGNMEHLIELQRARKARNTISSATRPQMQAREAEMGRHYAETLEVLLVKLLQVKGLHFVLAMGHAHSRE